MALDPKSGPNSGGNGGSSPNIAGDQPPKQQQPAIVLARWSTRFWAWLVDAIIINAALGALFGILSMPMWLYGLTNPRMMTTMAPIYGNEWFNGMWGPFSFAINSLVFFLYWTYMESQHNGQSIGKMLLHIRTTDLEGKQPDVKSIAISSFGKSFLLVIDVFFGWLFTNDKRQRLLARAANIIVVKINADSDSPMKVHYKKD